MAELKYSSIYGDLTRNVQARFDAASKLRKELFSTAIFPQYLDWDTPTVGLNFEELVGQYNVTVAAATLGDNSNEPIISTEGLNYISNKVFHHAITKPLTVQEYRKVLQLLDSKALSSSQRAEELVKIMWGDVNTVVDGVMAKIDMIFLGALSNEGKYEFDAANNPEGGVRGTIDFHQPTENIANAKTKWTNDNIDTVDCLEDIMEVIDSAQSKAVFEKILLDPSVISFISRSKKARQAVWGSDKEARRLQLADLNAFMQSNALPIFEPIRRQTVIQNGATKTPHKPFNAKNIVFVPAGKLGVVKNAYADSELRPEQGVTYSNYNRIRVSQWGVGASQNSNGVEFTKAEVYALPLVTEFNGVFTLKTQD